MSRLRILRTFQWQSLQRIESLFHRQIYWYIYLFIYCVVVLLWCCINKISTTMQRHKTGFCQHPRRVHTGQSTKQTNVWWNELWTYIIEYIFIYIYLYIKALWHLPSANVSTPKPSRLPASFHSPAYWSPSSYCTFFFQKNNNNNNEQST